MARIPVPDQINPRAIAGDRLAMQAPDLSAPARALQGLGSALSGLAADYEQNKSKMDQYNTNLQLERWSTDQTIQYQNDFDTAAPDGADFIQRREKGLTDSFAKVRAGIKDPELAAKADLVFEQTRGNQLVKGAQDVKKRQTSYVVATTNDSIKSMVESGALENKDQFNDYFENVVRPRIDGVIADPLQRQEAYAVFGTQLWQEYIKRNPEEALPKRTGGSLPIVTKTQAGRVSKGSIEGVSPTLVGKFKQVQDAFGRSIPIVSGFRDPKTNAKAGGAKKSQHMSGNAIDIDVSDLSIDERKRLIETASANGITGIGVYKNSLHFDLGGRRAWGPSRRRESVPAWAAASIVRHENGAARPQGQQPRDGNELWSRLIQTESGGDQSAVSPKGAIGRAQIMPGTGPEAAKLAGLPWDENRLKTDPEYNEALGKAYLGEQMKAFNGDAAKALAAYNAGPGRVKQAIAQYGDDWLKGVPAETRDYVSKILGGRSATVSYSMPEKPKGGIFEYMDDKSWNDAVKSGQAAFRDSLDLGIEQGEVTRPDIEMAPIEDGDKADLLRRWDKRNEDQGNLAGFVERLVSGGFVNAKDAKDRKAAGMLLDPAAIAASDPDAVAAMYDLYRKSGIVPDNAKGAIESMLRSRDASKVSTALSYLDALDRDNHRAFQQEFSAETSALLTEFRTGIDYQTPQQAAEKIMTATDPATESIRKERGKEAEKTVGKIELADVKDLFDPSYLPFNEPDMAIAPNAEAELMADYRQLYVDAYKLTGDDAQAKKAAADNLTRVWGVSAANGGRIMKWPPEVLYGPQAMVNGSYDWMRMGIENAMKDEGLVTTIKRTVTVGRGTVMTVEETVVLPYYLVATEKTRASAAAGRPAEYQLWYQDADGNYEIFPREIAFDVKSARDEARPGLERDQGLNLERRKRLDDAMKGVPPEGDIPGLGGEMPSMMGGQ